MMEQKCLLSEETTVEFPQNGVIIVIIMVQALNLWQKNIKSNLCDYSDACIYVTSDITASGRDANTDVALKNFDHLQNA